MIDIALGLVGAIVGGGLFSVLGERVFWDFDLRSMFVAVIGAVVVLVICARHLSRGDGPPRHPLTWRARLRRFR